MANIIVSPSILSADFANLERDIKLVERNGADWIHVDVMDGHFVPNITIGIPVVKSIKKVTTLPLDVHLMIENPEKYIEDFANAGADILTFHYEAVKKENIKSLITKIKNLGAKAGLSIKPKTQPEEILEFLPDLDLVLVMTVEQHATEHLFIQVDGGINAETGKTCTEYGANSLVAGSYIYKAENIKEAILSLKH